MSLEMAEWIGGPYDGSRVAVQPGWPDIRVPVLATTPPLPLQPEPEGIPTAMALDIVTVPIERKKDGIYLRWQARRPR